MIKSYLSLLPFALLCHQGLANIEFVPLGYADESSFSSYAYDISENGEVIAIQSYQNGPASSIVWQKNAGPVEVAVPSGFSSSFPEDVSKSGNYVVGLLRGSDFFEGSEAYLWNRQEGTSALGFLNDGDTHSVAYAVSAQGEVVVGYSGDHNGNTEAFIWTEAGGMSGIGFLSSVPNSRAYEVSSDGSTVIGYSSISDSDTTQAFVWTEADGMVEIQALAGNQMSDAYLVSEDGQFVAGQSTSEGYTNVKGFRWDRENGSMDIGHLPDLSETDVRAMTPDGSKIVGFCFNEDYSTYTPYFWTEAEGMTALDIPDSMTSNAATDISDSGQVIVGSSGNRAVLWDSERQLIDITDFLAENDIDIGEWNLHAVNSISGDGTTIIGIGTNPDGRTEAWAVLGLTIETLDGELPVLENDADALGNDYYWSPWIGVYYKDPRPGNRFILSDLLGWAWIAPAGASTQMWQWNFALESWLWGSPDTGMFFYDATGEEWIFLARQDGQTWVNRNGDWSILPQ